MSSLRVGLVGAGEMGRLHARTVAAEARRDASCVLVGVADHHPGRAAALARECGGRGCERLEEIVEDVDAMIVAVPTCDHFELACELLGRGLDLLVEKPLVESVAEGEELVARARRDGRILQVGHVEWYNPAWREAARRAGTIHRIEVERVSPPTTRARDIDVVQDLMLHDLDWVTRLVGEEIVGIETHARPTAAGRLEEVEATLHFQSGCTARLLASRIASQRRREARIEGSQATVVADLLTRSVRREGEGTGEVEEQSGDPSDPLTLQWRDFVEAVASRKQPPASGEVGLAALRLVDRVQRSVEADATEAKRDDDPRLRG
ncbi:MAG: Gfo/Idh/MocA family oxidoreductase [Deltaproteobacteria bacterium]|nr:Gfo/Idh/MocA family oxidoreductase [Deltaproteobacteria bacterium]